MAYLLVFLYACLCMGYAVDVAMALPIPPSLKHSPLGALNASLVAPPEVIFYSVFTTGKEIIASPHIPTDALLAALWFSVLGAYFLWVIRGVRTPLLVGRLSRMSSKSI
jgi:hypothetical protein